MTILLNDFKRQWAELEVPTLEAVRRVGASGWYILGTEVKAFEAALAGYWRLPHAVGVANGMDAIEISLRALGLRAGDRVLTTPMSAFATTLAILRCGAEPVFVDVDERGLIDFDLCEKALSDDPRLRFFVPVHLYGYSLDLERLERLKQRFELKLVEDCAQSIGAAFKGRPCGAVGQFAATSFYPTKNLGAFGDGGALLCSDGVLADAARQLRDYGQSQKYVHARQGLNSRLDEVHAAVLNDAALPRLNQWTERRSVIARRYIDGLKGLAGLTVPQVSSGEAPVWHLFPVRVAAARRASFQQALTAKGVSTGIHYPMLITDQPLWKERSAPMVVGSLARGQALAREEVSLPIHPYLTDAEVDAVIAACSAWSRAG